MKKLLLVAAASATILSSTLSFADIMDNQWYLRADVGATIFNKEKDKTTGLKMKSNTAFVGGVGVGYYVMDNFRTDLTLSAVANGQLKKTGAITNGVGAGTNGSVKHKPSVTSLLVNGYFDFAELDTFKFFAGAGIGAALVKEKITFAGLGIVNNDTTISSVPSSSTKNKYNFAYQLTLGSSFEVTDGVKAELAYSWKDYGKTKSKRVPVAGKNVEVGGVHYKGNNLTAGVRFDI